VSRSESGLVLAAPWAGIVPLDDLSGYVIHGFEPGKHHALSITPKRVTVRDVSPLKAYQRLTALTGHAWCIAVREHDLVALDRAHWTEMVRGIPRIKMISEHLWNRAKPIWDEAFDEPASSRALWLALTATHEEELRVPREVRY
jgi:hypothetical protein